MSFHHKLFQIFRAGTHTSAGGTPLVFSKQDLEHMAAGYSKKRLRAPLVLGHPADNIPEYGESDALFVNDGKLYAQATVSDTLQEMVRAGRYKYVSPSLFAPDSPLNPTPGVYYLRHIGFLGAQPPAVKGMAALKFSECSGNLSFAECYGKRHARASSLATWLSARQGAYQGLHAGRRLPARLPWHIFFRGSTTR